MKIVILGGGGHARVVLALVRAIGSYEVVAILDDDESKLGSLVDGVSVSGPISDVANLPHDVGIVAVGDNRQRRNIVERTSLRWARLIHPHAWVDESVVVGDGSVVFAGCVVQPGTEVGEHVILNSGVVVDHDCRIGSYAHVAPGAVIAGAVELGEGVLMGVGSSVVPAVDIGAWSRVGAGAVVLDDVPAGVDAVGVPARNLAER